MSAATRLILIKGTTAQRTAYTPIAGELVYDTDLGQVYVGDGSTAGGNLVGVASTTIFGSQFDYQTFTNTVSFSTTTLFQIYQRSLTTRPPGTYRIMIHYAYEPGSTGSNDHSEIRVNDSTANIEQVTFEDEGKDTGSDIRRTKTLLGYYTKTTTSTFTIELYARNEGGTTVMKGATIESWRVA